MLTKFLASMLTVVSAFACGPLVAQDIDPRVKALVDQSSEYVLKDKKKGLEIANQALALAKSLEGPESPEVAAAELVIGDLGWNYLSDEVVESHYQIALKIRRSNLPPNSTLIADALTQIASLRSNVKGAPSDAIEPAREAVAIYEANHIVSWQYEAALEALAGSYWRSGQRRLATSTYQRMLSYLEMQQVDRSSSIASALWSMAMIQWELGNTAEYDKLAERLESVRPDSSNMDVWATNSRVVELESSGKYDQAEQILRRALASDEVTKSTDFVFMELADDIRLKLADILAKTGRYDEAEAIVLEVIATRGTGASFGRVAYINALLSGVKLFDAQKRFSDSDRMIAAIDRVYSRTGLAPESFQADQIIDYFLRQARYDEALLWSSRAIQSIRRLKSSGPPTESSGSMEQQQAGRFALYKHLDVIRAGWSHFLKNPSPVLIDSFEIGQLTRPSGVGQSIAKMAARQAAMGDEFAIGLRELQDGYEDLSRVEAELLRLSALSQDARAGKSLEQTRAGLEARRTVLDARDDAFAARYPNYRNLVSQSPLSLAEAGSLLNNDEVLLVYSVGIGATYIWVVRRDKSMMLFSPVGSSFLSDAVRDLRKRLTSGESGFAPTPMAPHDGAKLYSSLLSGVIANGFLDGMRHIIVVGDGPLQSLPFSVLPDGTEESARWLGARYAFSYLPSVSSLKAVRGVHSPNVGEEPFLGFGDPAIGGDAPGSRLSLRAVFGNSEQAKNGKLANVEVLRAAPALPETADELRAEALALGATDSSVYLGDKATEKAVRSMDLSHYAVISFATHGVMAGELELGMEPGLVLTPPAVATTDDDGFLTASEIAPLKLNADWVLLSACNTAAPDGSPRSEGFSGLANSFLYAGARALLVSHWQVSSAATSELVTAAVERYASNRSEGKAAALKYAMSSLMKRPEYAHPYFWAAFSLVGE